MKLKSLRFLFFAMLLGGISVGAVGQSSRDLTVEAPWSTDGIPDSSARLGCMTLNAHCAPGPEKRTTVNLVPNGQNRGMESFSFPGAANTAAGVQCDFSASSGYSDRSVKGLPGKSFHCRGNLSRTDSYYLNGPNCSSDSECNSGVVNYRCSPTTKKCVFRGKPGWPCSGDNECNGTCTSQGVCGFSEQGDAFCVQDSDCASGRCTSNKCVFPQGEGAICSGSGDCAPGLFCKDKQCTKKGIAGASCSNNDACLSSRCGGGKCIAPTNTRQGLVGAYCEANEECESGKCDNYLCAKRTIAGGENGDHCTTNSQCDSGYCADGRRCAPRDGTGRLGEYCHHNNHCGAGMICNCPAYSGGFCSDYDKRTNNGIAAHMTDGDFQCVLENKGAKRCKADTQCSKGEICHRGWCRTGSR